ncbi:MAG: family lipase, partial [Mucilaginibacter sp.]|nr:family lipase [Mucilaginibacter sp.]
MKKIVFILFFSLISIAAISQNLSPDTVQYEKKYYQKRTAIFNSEPVIKGKIIFLGNSLTQFGDWKKLLNDSSVINRGIAADNTNGVLARLNDVIIRQPAKLFIEIGINDISQNIPLQIIVKNILLIVERVHAQSPETKIYVDSILPTNDNAKNEY